MSKYRGDNMSDETNHDTNVVSKPRSLARIRFQEFVILVILLALIYILITPIRPSRNRSRGPQTINNLKNVALAQQNFASQTEGFFAPPTTLLLDGTPGHSWATQLLPLIDHASVYDRIDQSVPWDHENNREEMSYVFSPFLVVEFDQERNSDGFGLNHFTLNQRLFPDNKSLTEDYISQVDGLSNTILMGEIQEGLMPWGAPGNARDPALGLKPGSKTMGVSVHDGVTIIGFADGRVMAVSNDIDPTVLKALSTPDGGETIPEGSW